MSDTTLFQYCQKIVLFRHNDTEVLLARRQGEADYDGTYTFIGGKMETTDASILEGLRREKNEEVGDTFQIRINPMVSYNVHFVKNSGQHMILPHYYAEYIKGDIQLSDEYDDCQWVPLSELSQFSPKVENIPQITATLLASKRVFESNDFVVI